MGQFPYAEIKGTPYEIGYQHGSLFKEKVLGSIDCYRKMFMDYSKLEWDRAKVLSRRFEPGIREYNPDYIEEIKGVADGAGLDFEDILALNCRSELVFVGKELEKTDGACTSIGVNEDGGKDGNAYIAHNWDWKPTQRDCMVMMKIEQQGDKPSIFMITEAGIIGKTGFNSAGICLALNALVTDESGDGLPLHIAMRGILDSVTLAGTIRAATKMHLGCCANFMIAAKNGEVIDIEIENEDFDVLYPKDGIIVHTNHFVSLRLPRYPRKDAMKLTTGDSFIRLGRAERLVRRIPAGTVTEEKLMAIMKDHGEYPSGICRHGNPKLPPGLQLGTVFGIIMCPTAGKLWFCKGNPCDTPYELYEPFK